MADIIKAENARADNGRTGGQSKSDAAAERAFAQAAEKKSAAAATANARPVGTAAKADAAPAAKKPDAKAGRKPAAAKAAGTKAPAKSPVYQAAAETDPVTTPISQLKEKIMTTTQNTDYTETARTAAAEFQTRAQAAYDKSAELTADVTAFHKGNFDAMIESGRVLAAGMQDIGRTAIEEARTAAETVTEDFRKMAAVKSPTELFQLQGEIVRRNLDTLVARTSKNTEIMMKLAGDVFAPLSSRASVAVESVRQAA